MSKFNLLFKSAERFLEENSTTILTGVGVVGTISTAVLAVRGGMKAQQKIDEEHDRRHQENGTATPFFFTKTDKAKIVWLDLAPAVGSGALTIGAIVCAHRISAGRVAAMATAYSLSESKLKQYKQAIEEKLGVESKQQVDEHVAELRKDQAVPVERQAQRPIIISGDQQLFFDIYSGRYFEASMEELRSAENDMNYKVIQDIQGQCPLSHFYETIGLPAIATGDDWGWDSTCPAEFKYSPNIDDKTGKACIWVDFEVEPLRGWNHLER